MNFDEIIKKQMETLTNREQITDLEDYASGLTNGLSENYSLDNILDATVKGESVFDTGQIIESLKALFFYETKAALAVGIEILSICIIIGLLHNLTASFGKKGVSEIASLVCCIVVIGLAMTNFNTAFQMTMDAVKTITYTMEILLPVLLAVLISMGQVASGTIMNPLLLTSVTVFQAIIKEVVMPVIFAAAVFSLLNGLTEKDYVNKLSKLLRQAALFITGILMTLMYGIIAVQGLIAKTSDSLIMGTAKFSLDAFIPIVGGFTSDTVELFLTCMGSIKNIIGLFGILMIVTLILSPLIKILAIAIVYKVTALVIDPIAPKKLSDAVSDIGSTLISMGAILFLSSLMFIIFITSVINLGGTT